MSHSVKEEICDLIYQAYNGWFNTVTPDQIRTVEFRPGLAQIDVTYHIDYKDGTTDRERVTIDSLPVLNAVLQRMIDEEK